MKNLIVWACIIGLAFLFYRSWSIRENEAMVKPEPATKTAVATAAVSDASDTAGRAGMWTDRYRAAVTEAQTSNRPMLLDFTGSDWCGWCIKLDKEVFSKKEFIEYAKTNLILVKIDFPRGKKQTPALVDQNQKLAQQYRVNGFPTIILVSGEGKILGTTGYRDGGAAAYVQHLKGIVGK